MRRVALFAALLALAALGAGCSKKGVLTPDVPPETALFVQGPVDPVNHNVHLYWFGSDPDGDVKGFEYRFNPNPSLPADTQWVFTTETDKEFTVFTGNDTIVAPVFQVRAVDDADLRDPTPATQDFRFTNKPPSMVFNAPPQVNDTTYYSLTLRWTPQDPDGSTAKMSYRVWLNGNIANARIVTGTQFTVPSADFLAGDSAGAGTRIVYAQPIDDGGLAGGIVSARWQVRPPAPNGGIPRVLLVDDVPSTVPGAFGIDSLMSNALARNLPANSYSILRMEFTQPFRSAQDVAQTFGLYRAVIWYRSIQTTTTSVTAGGPSAVLGTYGEGVADYLEHGGTFVIEGLNPVAGTGAGGVLDASFTTRFFGSDGLYRYERNPGDSSVAWGINTGQSLYSSVLSDSLRILQIYTGLRGFMLRDTANCLAWALPGVLSQNNPVSFPVAVTVPQTSGGRAVAISFPLRGANGYGTAPRFLSRLLGHLGLLGP